MSIITVYLLYHPSPLKADDSALWQVTALGIGVLSYSQTESDIKKYNELADENDQLNEDYQKATSTAEMAKIKKQHDANLEEMDSYKSSANNYRTITVLSIVWSLYLLFSDSSPNRADTLPDDNGLIPDVNYTHHLEMQQHTLNLTWRF